MTEATYHVIADIQEERFRQMSAEGWTPEHDDTHKSGQMADAACCYAMTEHKYNAVSDRYDIWPWEPRWFKPTDRRRDLVKAAALIVAEIERLDRSHPTPSSPSEMERRA